MIILASQSVQRKKLFEAIGIDFKIVPADLDEKAISHKSPAKRVEMIAEAKAREIAKKYPEDIVVAGDSFNILNGETLEKPESKREAVEMLKKQSGQMVRTYTGVCYLDPAKKIEEVAHTITKMWFRDLSDEEIEFYVKSEPVTTWAGGYSPAYTLGTTLFKKTEGSLTGFAHGFPMEIIIPLLKRSGVGK